MSLTIDGRPRTRSEWLEKLDKGRKVSPLKLHRSMLNMVMGFNTGHCMRMRSAFDWKALEAEERLSCCKYVGHFVKGEKMLKFLLYG